MYDELQWIHIRPDLEFCLVLISQPFYMYVAHTADDCLKI